MKIGALCIAILLAAGLSACGGSGDVPTPPPGETAGPRETAEPGAVPADGAEAEPAEAETADPALYRDVLLGRTPLLYGAEGAHCAPVDIADVPAIFDPQGSYAAIGDFVVIDLDGGGADEVVLHITNVGNDMGGYLVLRQEQDAVYGFPFDYRTFWSLKTDGTYQYSEPAGTEDGIASIRFAEGRCIVDRLLYWEGERFEPSRFTMDGREVSQEEYSAALEEQDQKPDAAWEAFTEDNIQTLS